MRRGADGNGRAEQPRGVKVKIAGDEGHRFRWRQALAGGISFRLAQANAKGRGEPGPLDAFEQKEDFQVGLEIGQLACALGGLLLPSILGGCLRAFDQRGFFGQPDLEKPGKIDLSKIRQRLERGSAGAVRRFPGTV